MALGADREILERFFVQISGSLGDTSGGGCVYRELFESPHERRAIEAERRMFVSHLFEDSLRFAGTKMIRRILGLAHVEELESIADRKVRALCELDALEFARKLVLEASSFGNVTGHCGGASNPRKSMKIDGRHYRTIWSEGESVFVIDQTKLPHQFEVVAMASGRRCRSGDTVDGGPRRTADRSRGSVWDRVRDEGRPFGSVPSNCPTIS